MLSVPKLRRAVTCLRDRTGLLDELRPGLSCGAAGREVDVNIAISCMLNEVPLNGNTDETRVRVDRQVEMLWPGAPRNLTLCFP